MIELWYGFLDAVFPFEWLQYHFMKNAFLAVLLISPIFAILGTMVVNNRMAFFSDALGHGAFTGIAIGLALGSVHPLGSAVVFSVLFSVFITWLKDRSRASTDTIIGVFSSTAIAAGIVLVSLRGSGMGKYNAFLVGDILSITPSDLFVLLLVFAGVLLLWFFLFNRFLLLSINRSLAVSRGVKAIAIDMVFTGTIAVIVTVSIHWVGLLIINSLLVLPAAAARNISSNMRQYHLFSLIIALFSGILGLVVSYFIESATGATMVLFCTFFYFITLVIKRKLG